MTSGHGRIAPWFFVPAEFPDLPGFSASNILYCLGFGV
jgi:hypothetical protein